MDFVLIKLLDMTFNRMFSDPLCWSIGPAGGFCFNQIAGHDFQQDVLRSSLLVYRSCRWILF